MKAVAEAELVPISMEEAVGYPALACEFQTPSEHALVLKHNRYFLLTNPHGDIKPAGHCSLGLFRDDTRILSHYDLRVCGGSPSLLSVQVPHSYSGQIDLAINDAEFGGDSWDPKNCFHIRRELLLVDRLIERVTLTNYLPRIVEYWIELLAGCDFADIFELRGWKRQERGQFYQPRAHHDSLVFAYRGRDGELIESAIRFGEAPSQIHAKGARWNLELPPKGQFQMEWEIAAVNNGGRRAVWNGFGMEEQRKQMDEAYRRWTGECTQWATPAIEFKGILERAVDDLRALYVESHGESVISAGIPWYSTIFGRDAIITSLETLCLNPQIAIDTLRHLARHQGERENSFTDEQPGKIMHELRRGEMARNGEIPHLPYYGTIDATPLWLVLLHETWRWTGDDQLVRELLPNAQRALEWIENYGDIDGDGLVEYRGNADGGLANQGWKDSGDGVPFPDARQPEPPIALVEVQGYVYDALARTAALYQAFGEEDRAASLRKKAERLREKISEHFWMEDIGFFGLALDGQKQLLPTMTTNAGHLLWSGVASPEQARRMARHLLGPDMFSGWGIRTVSASHRVFNPMSYHNGSVWPHDNAIVLMGLARYGMADLALPVINSLYQAAAHSEFLRLPELFCGMPRAHATHPVYYPVSCSPQAWASGAFFLMLQAFLGIHPDAPEGVLHIRNPVLPSFVEELSIGNCSVGKAKVSLQFQRYRNRTMANLLSVTGDPLHVRIELC